MLIRRGGTVLLVGLATFVAGCGGSSGAVARQADALGASGCSAAIQTNPQGRISRARCLPDANVLRALEDTGGLALLAQTSSGCFVLQLGPDFEDRARSRVADACSATSLLARAPDGGLWVSTGQREPHLFHLGDGAAARFGLEEPLRRTYDAFLPAASLRVRELEESAALLAGELTMMRRDLDAVYGSASREAIASRVAQIRERDAKKSETDAQLTELRCLTSGPPSTVHATGIATDASSTVLTTAFSNGRCSGSAIVWLDAQGRWISGTMFDGGVERHRTKLRTDARGSVYVATDAFLRRFERATPWPTAFPALTFRTERGYVPLGSELELVRESDGVAVVSTREVAEDHSIAAFWLTREGREARHALSHVVVGPLERPFGLAGEDGAVTVGMAIARRPQAYATACRLEGGGERCVDVRAPDAELFPAALVESGGRIDLVTRVVPASGASAQLAIVRVSL